MTVIVVLIFGIGIAIELRYRGISMHLRQISDLLVHSHKSWAIENFYLHLLSLASELHMDLNTYLPYRLRSIILRIARLPRINVAQVHYWNFGL
jgi:hypothetical protein